MALSLLIYHIPIFPFLNLRSDWEAKKNASNGFASLRQKSVDGLWFRHFLFLPHLTHTSCVGGILLLCESNNGIYILAWDMHLIFSFPSGWWTWIPQHGRQQASFLHACFSWLGQVWAFIYMSFPPSEDITFPSGYSPVITSLEWQSTK